MLLFCCSDYCSFAVATTVVNVEIKLLEVVLKVTVVVVVVIRGADEVTTICIII